MRHSLIPIALVLPLIFGGGYNERYCAFADGGAASYESCSFPTFEACRAYVGGGVGGSCRINGRFVEEPPRRHKPRKRYHQ